MNSPYSQNDPLVLLRQLLNSVEGQARLSGEEPGASARTYHEARKDLEKVAAGRRALRMAELLCLLAGSNGVSDPYARDEAKRLVDADWRNETRPLLRRLKPAGPLE